jgi:hypothetical protein
MFAVLKLFFFNGYLDSKLTTEKEKSEYVLNNLIERTK